MQRLQLAEIPDPTAQPQSGDKWRAVLDNSELAAALALCLVYCAIVSGHLYSIDGLLMYRQATSLLFQHSLHFSKPLWWGGEEWSTSRYGIGLSLLYTPSLLIWSWLAPYIPTAAPGHGVDWNVMYMDPLYTAACAPVHILITGATAYLVARFILVLNFSRRIALFGLALYGLASPALIYSRGDFSQPLEALCWVAALFSTFRYRESAGKRFVVAAALAVGYGVLTRPVEGTLLLPAVLALGLPATPWHFRFRSTWLLPAAVVASYVLAFVATLLVNQARYNSPLITGYYSESWTASMGPGLLGVLISPGRGILWEFPAILLLPLGVRSMWLNGYRRLSAVFAVLSLAQLINVAAWHSWWGGWDWGLRLFLPALPLIAIVSTIGIVSLPREWKKWIAPAVFTLGVLWSMPAVLTDLTAGYGQRFAGVRANFSWSSLPFISAWGSLHRWQGSGHIDFNTIDILWFRDAASSGYTSLLPPTLFLVAAALLTLRAVRATETLGSPFL